jgi:hypothetical protein
MAFPEGLPTTLVQYNVAVPAGGGSAVGTVRLELNVPAATVPGYGRVFTGAGTYSFNTDGDLVDAQGNVGVRVLPNDVPGMNPQKTLWLVTETIGGRTRTYYTRFSVTQTEADLSAQQNLDPNAPQYVPVAGPPGAQGPKGDKGDPGDATDALLASNNLSDLDDPVAARTALGLGTAATQPTGAFDAAGSASTAQTAATTAAAGDATTKVTAHTNAADPHGDRAWAGGTFDPLGSADAAQAAAEAYTDNAVAGEADRADAAYDPAGAAAAALTAANAYTDAHASGGGGGVLPTLYIDQIDAGIIVLTNSATWQPVVGSNGVHVRRIIPNVTAGDAMQFTAEFLRIGTVYFLDGRILKGDGTPSRYLSSGTATSGTEGYAPWYTQSSFKGVTGFRTFVVQADEIAADGSWTIEMVSQSSNIVDDSNHLYFGAGYNGSFDVWHWPFGA